MSGTEFSSNEEPVSVPSRPAVNHRIHARTLHDVTRYLGSDPVFIDERIRELEREWTLERTLEANSSFSALIASSTGWREDHFISRLLA